VAGHEAVAGALGLNGELVDLAGLEQLLALEAVAVAGADDAVRQVEVKAVRVVVVGRADVDQLGGEVGVDR
jgi:hypothetical protein